jgi:SAM-dependent methyltransferase
MKDYEEATYGNTIADIYDELYPTDGQTKAAVAFLAEHARQGSALELGIGTGRIALPLAEVGVRVEGVDASEAMVARLRAKPGGTNIPVTFSTIAKIPGDGQFSVIFTVSNTFFGLTSQEEQVGCFQSIAAHLAPDGVFVMEAFVPDISRFTKNQATWVGNVDLKHVWLDAATHDPISQQVRLQHVVLSESGIRFYPVVFRYAWPSELDLMAKLAGLRLRERWGGWNREPYRAQSHVSVYERSRRRDNGRVA